MLPPEKRAEIPQGYNWTFCPDIKAFFPTPDTWFYKEEVKGDTRAYFMTRESIAQRGRFDTGIAVNVLSGIRKKVKTSPSLYAHSFMTSQTDMRPTSDIVMSNDGSLRVARRYFEITPGIKHGVRFEHKNLYVEATAND